MLFVVSNTFYSQLFLTSFIHMTFVIQFIHSFRFFLLVYIGFLVSIYYAVEENA